MSIALFSNKAIGIKVEAENGVQETLNVSNYGLECTDITASSAPEVIEKNVFRGSISASPNRIGKISGTASLAGELKNSGVLNTLPKIDPVLTAARFARSSVKTAVIILNGDIPVFKPSVSIVKSETISAVVLDIQTIEETTTLYYATLVEEHNFSVEDELTIDDVVFGVVESLGDNAGFLYKPSSTQDSEKCVTLEISDGGLRKTIYGSTCNFTLTLGTGSYPQWTAEFTGIANPDTWGSVAAPPANIAYEEHQPPVVVESKIRIGDDLAPMTQTVSLDLGNTVFLIDDLNSPTWYRYSLITKRAATGTVSFLAEIEEAEALYQRLFAGEVAAMQFRIGDGAGNEIQAFLPAVQYTAIAESDNNSALAEELTLNITGTDNEISLWFK